MRRITNPRRFAARIAAAAVIGVVPLAFAATPAMASPAAAAPAPTAPAVTQHGGELTNVSHPGRGHRHGNSWKGKHRHGNSWKGKHRNKHHNHGWNRGHRHHNQGWHGGRGGFGLPFFLPRTGSAF